MIHRFILFSEDVKDFVMEIKAPSTCTFLDLYNLIMQDCGYVETGNHRFLICDEDWHVRQKIHLHDIDAAGYEEDVNLMESSCLGDFMDDEGQHLAFVYDIIGKRIFLMEMVENVFGESLSAPMVSRKKGIAPEQFELEDIDDMQSAKPATPQSIPDDDGDEEETDDNGYDNDEIDLEGFEIEEH